MGATKSRTCCCPSCVVGSVIDRWKNVTKVRAVGDTVPTSLANIVPFARYDETQYNVDNYPDTCISDHPAGSGATLSGYCGNWLQGGDQNGVPQQEVDPTKDDIIACATPDTTHATDDHNCYEKSGTVDMTASKLFGGQWILARKYWHGMFGFIEKDYCSPDPTEAPCQTKYRRIDYDVSTYSRFYTYTSSTWYDRTQSISGGREVASKSGIITSDLLTEYEYNEYDVNNSLDFGNVSDDNLIYRKTYSISGGVGTYTDHELQPDHSFVDTVKNYAGQYAVPADIGVTAAYSCSDLPVVPDPFWGVDGDGKPNKTLSGIIDWWNTNHPSDTIPAISDVNNYSAEKTVSFPSSYDGPDVVGTTTDYIKISWTRTNTQFIYSVEYYERENRTDLGLYPASDLYSKSTATITLSQPYTSAECYDDFLILFAAWNVSDLNLAKLRTDEKLALAPLLVYDEVTTTSPFGFNYGTMDDYSGTLIDDSEGRAPGDPSYETTWTQRAWVDPNNYIWQSPTGNYYSQQSSAEASSTLVTPMWKGEAVSHTQAGSDRHFWFNYLKQQRLFFDPGGGSSRWEWFNYKHGDYSDPLLPPVTKRWMDNEEAQYDAGAYRNGDPIAHDGNYPQQFLTQKSGVIRGAKYIAATQKWPSVNYARPCGEDRYAVDQTTVCCINGGDAASGFTVKKTGNAIEPLAAGGLAKDDYMVVEDDGIYQISDIVTDSPDAYGNAQWKVTVGSKLDDLPTGYNFSDPEQGGDGGTHLGRLRWVNYSQYSTTWTMAPGICGRVAITKSYDSGTGTLTIMPADSLPWLREDVVAGGISVDIYDASMTPLATGLGLTRVSDSEFTVVHADISGSAYMCSAGVDYTKNDSSSKRTGLLLKWQFNQRWADGSYPTPPPWYAGISGCLSCDITQFNYSLTSKNCPTFVGIVPFYAPVPTGDSVPTGDAVPGAASPIETYENAVLYDFPATFDFDDVYGAHYQSAVILTMPDPFYQQPYKQDCDVESPDVCRWTEDDGSGNQDSEETTEGGATIFHRYFAHHPLVEASSEVPAGASLPTGISLTYNGTVNEIAPPYYPHGIPIGDSSGSYGNIETDWAFALRACANISSMTPRFKTDYQAFVTCT